MIRSLTLIVMVLLLSFSTGCKKVPLLADEGAVLILVSDRSWLDIGGDSSTITILGYAASGLVVHDQTSVMVSTTLGRIEPTTVELQTGQAQVRLISDHKSGVARVTARSGQISADPIDISIGSAALAGLVMNCTPASLSPGGGTALVKVYAYDASGNLLPKIPVVFSSDLGRLLDGAMVRTNAEGLAQNRISVNETTRVRASSGEKTVDFEIRVEVQPDNKLPEARMVISPTSPTEGETVWAR